MTSGGTFPQHLTKVDELMLPDHVYLNEEDTCFFLGEYTARRGYAFSATNQLIFNFKKSMSRRSNPAEWRYKGRAIQEAAAAFRNALNLSFLDQVTFVPIPPSKAKDDPEYDDRITQMLHHIRPAPPVDVRELILQTHSTDPAHGSDDRLSPDELVEIYELDETLTTLEIKPGIVVVDDVLTTGSHYRAVQTVLSDRFPEVEIAGLFIARRVPGAEDIWDL